MNDGGEISLEPQRVRIAVVSRDVGEHYDHVFNDLFVAAPHRGEVKAAALCRVPPRQEEVSYLPALASVAFRMSDEAP